MPCFRRLQGIWAGIRSVTQPLTGIRRAVRLDGMDIAVLGPLEVNGTSRGLSRRDRVILAALVVHRGETVSREQLADALWGETVPDSWPKVVQGCVVRLRKLLGANAIETTPDGYRLRAHAQEVDAQRFEQLLGAAREQLALGDPDRALYALGQALALWRGHPLVELEDWSVGQAEMQRLQELRYEAEDLHTEASLRAGQQLAVLAAATRRVSEAPLRERRWALLAEAQYLAGRQGDALLTLRRARTMLASELGLDPGPELLDLESAILNQDPQLHAQTPLVAPSATCPYPGLPAYDVDDAATFFGREADIAACLERLDAAGVLAVVGPSGCGKSSLVRAGIAAALRNDGRRVVVVTPGTQPLDSLVELESTHAAVVVDQGEEIFSEAVDAADRAVFVDALVRRSGRGELVFALRADRLGQLAAYPALARIVERGLYLLGPMREPDLRAAIEGPARHAGLRLEPGLVDLLVREVEGQPGALPLLSHVLRQTWLRREGGTLTVAAYRASGGIRQAVAQSAESLYERMPAAQRTLLRDLMLRLVARDPDGEPTATRIPRVQVSSDPNRVALVEQLVHARLLSTDDANIEIAHEALAREWPRLQAWLDEDVEGLRILRHLSVAADTWQAMGRPDSELYRGVRLARALEWRAAGRALSEAEAEFLDASIRAAKSQQLATEQQVMRERRTNRRLRTALAAGAAALLIAVTSGLLAANSAGQAQSEAVAADARRVGAEALTAARPDSALLLALAGVRLDPTSEVTRFNLMAALNRAAQLRRATSDVPAAGAIAVNPRTGSVVLTEPLKGVTVLDGKTLRATGFGEQGGGYATAASPDGRLLATSDSYADPTQAAADPQPVRLLGPQGRALSVQPGGIPKGFADFWSVAFSGNGRRVVAVLSAVSGQVQRLLLGVWDTGDPSHPVALISTPPSLPATAALSWDGRTVYTNGDGSFGVFDVRTGRQRASLTGPQLGLEPLPVVNNEVAPPVVVSPDGRTIAVVANSEVGLLDAATFKLKARLSASGRVASVAFSANGHRFAAADTGITVWDLTSAKPVQVFRADSGTGPLVALSPDGNTAYSAVRRGNNSGQSGGLLAWDDTGSSGVVRQSPAAPKMFKSYMARVSPDGQMIAYLANTEGRIEVRDVRTGRMLPWIDPEDNADTFSFDLAWRPDSKAVTGVISGTEVMAWDPRNAHRFANRSLDPELAVTAQYAADGRLFVGTDRGNLYVLDGQTLKTLGPPIKVLNETLESLEVSPDGHTVLVSGSTHRVLVNYETGLRSWPNFPYTGFFSRDGKTMAVVDGDGAVGFMATDTYRWLAPPDPSHAYGDWNSAFSSDGQWFASSRAGTVGLWSVRTGKFVGAVPAGGDVAVGFSSDNSRVIIANINGSVQTWAIRLQSWIDAACTIAGRELSTQEWAAALPDQPYRKVCSTAE